MRGGGADIKPSEFLQGGVNFDFIYIESSNKTQFYMYDNSCNGTYKFIQMPFININAFVIGSRTRIAFIASAPPI